jgi:hypothetical protein
LHAAIEEFMDLKERIESFAGLGEILRNALDGKGEKTEEEINHLIKNQHKQNPWFTPENVRMAIRAIADELTLANLTKWTDSYPVLRNDFTPLRVGVIMAGNIPLAGFHDFLSVLISGNSLIAKTSSKDADLIVHISRMLCSINSDFRSRIEFTESPLSNFDIIIATGSDNSSRYFEYYFGKYPRIIRKNRNSVAVIENNETDSELEELGRDIFSYFGLGCRNVSKVFIPVGYDLDRLFRNWKGFSGIINHNRYANNHDFNLAVFIVNKEVFLDTGFLLLKENKGLTSPVSVLYYEFYNSVDEVYELLHGYSDKIQCIVGKRGVGFGRAQSPALWDWADNIDTLDFLLKKNMSGIL